MTLSLQTEARPLPEPVPRHGEEPREPSSSLLERVVRCFDAEFIRQFTVVFLACLVARGGALALAFHADDYSALESGGLGGSDFFVAQGRFGWAALAALSKLVGWTAPQAYHASTLLEMAGLCALAVVVARFFRLSGRAALAVALLVVLHPYQAETFTLRINGLFVGAVLWLLVPLFARVEHGRADMVAGTLLMASALSIYQTALGLAAMIVVWASLLELARGGLPGWRSHFRKVVAPRVLSIVLGFTLYLVVNKLVLAVLRIPLIEGRYDLVSRAGLGERVHKIIGLLTQILWAQEPIEPAALKVLSLAVLALGLAGLAVRAWQQSKERPRAGAALVGLALIGLGIAVLLIPGVHLVMAIWWPVPRSMTQLAVYVAGSFALCHEVAPLGWRPSVAAAGIAFALLFMGINGHVFSEQQRVTRRDELMASRIFARMEAQPEFADGQEIAFVGANFASQQGLVTAYMNMNISSFIPSFSQVALMREISGYAFKPADDPAFLEKARASCLAQHPWPAPDSVQFLEGRWVVCLGR